MPLAQTDCCVDLRIKLRPGYGYWDVTAHPIGGEFHRAPVNGLILTVLSQFERQRGVNARGQTDSGRLVCVDLQYCDEI